MAPANDGLHGEPQMDLSTWVGYYAVNTTGTRASLQPTLILPKADNKPEPDSLLRILRECGGGSWNDAEGWLHGVPELVCEVANTTAAKDLGVKYDTYEAAGVREYIVWRTAAGLFDWFVLAKKKYVALTPDPADGLLKSVAFPGLWLDVPALLAGNGRRVLETLQKGLATPEHAAFEAKLATAAKKKPKPKKKK
jgi:Uma2 family endonuclease